MLWAPGQVPIEPRVRVKGKSRFGGPAELHHQRAARLLQQRRGKDRRGSGQGFLYGSFAARMLGDAGPAPHDIDVMVLGEPDVDAVYQACTRVEAAVHRPVNPTILSPEEFAAPSRVPGQRARRPGSRPDRGPAVALTLLTRVQQATVLAWVEARRLLTVPADPPRSFVPAPASGLE